jgi:hypothetical protein
MVTKNRKTLGKLLRASVGCPKHLRIRVWTLPGNKKGVALEIEVYIAPLFGIKP